jgi:transaldolase/glucose-6-phosphate isomerase
VNGIALQLPADLQAEVNRTLADWEQGKKMQRLWDRDATLWTGQDESRWLGWLDVIDPKKPVPAEVEALAKVSVQEGFRQAVLLGMGGSSLCPEVMALTFGPVKGRPELLVLDSTDPVQIQTLAERIDPAKTLFFVSSKSGSTLEPNIFFDFFWAKVVEAVGAAKAGRYFVAITDPGSHLESVAKEHGFRAVLPGIPSIGGRYSALSNFGVAPAAVMGVDVQGFLERTLEMVRACAGTVPASKNPGGILGAVLGTLGKGGRNKVTLITSPGIGDLGAWLEQLLAESTGKQGQGLIPVDREPTGSPEKYGKDRIFAYLRLEPAPDAKQDAAVDALAKAGQPVVRIAVKDALALGQEFFRWEIATAVAGSILGIDAFNQPDVEASKIATKKITETYEKTGALPGQTPFFEEGSVALYADPLNAAALQGGKTLAEVMRLHLGRLGAGDYLAILAYVPMNDRTEAALQGWRLRVRDARRVATCLGFGPRFQHSTGQAYKGGPNTGVFVQVTCDDPVQLPVPGHKYTFGVVKEAQARGDLQVLAERKRRLVRVHLKGDLAAGLKRLAEAVDKAV